MKKHFIVGNLIYVCLDPKQTRNTERNTISFRADVYRLNNNPDSTDLLGIKLKDDVEVGIPMDTQFIYF